MPTDAAAAVQNFLQSLQGNQSVQSQAQQAQQAQGKLFTTLPELLTSTTTIPIVDSANEAIINKLLSHLPPTLLILNQESDDTSFTEPTTDAVNAAIEALNLDQKRDILRKVLRSPQFSQSLGSFTQAIRDGGLPTIGDALNIPVANGGFVKAGSGVPMGGGDAVEAFVDGIKSSVEKEEKDDGKMDTE